MRLGFDAHVLDGRNQGTKTLMLRLIDQVARRHSEHEIFVYSETPHPELDFGLPNLHFRATPDLGSFRRLLKVLPAAKRADHLDTMIFNFISSPAMGDATVMMHDILPQTHPRYFSPRFVVRCWLFYAMSTLRAKSIFTISAYSRREIRQVYPWTRRQPIDVLHIGPSFTPEVYFAASAVALPKTLENIGRYVLCVGRMEPRKNTQMAIDAFHAHAPNNVKLVIVGRREPGTKIDLHDDQRIIEAGGLSDDELAAVYRNASLFVYSSSAEGFGLPLLDAILFGIPVIASSRTSMAEVGGECATFFDPEATGATEWLGQRIAAHFGSMVVPAATLPQREERLSTYSWARAADELVAGISNRLTGAATGRR